MSSQLSPQPAPQPRSSMPTWLKVLLIVGGCLFVLGGACVAAGMWWWSRNGEELTASMEKGWREGAEAGRGTDERGCVSAAMARNRDAAGVGGMLGSGFFLRGCLPASRDTPGFCQGVPRPGEFTAGVKWMAQRCPGTGTSSQACQTTMRTVQEFCAAGEPKLGGTPVPGWNTAPGDSTS